MDEETVDETVDIDIGGEKEPEKVKEVKEIVVPAAVVYKAATLTDDLSKLIRTMKLGRWAGVDPTAIFLSSIAEKIENGKLLEEVMEEVEKEVLLILAGRYEISKELATVLKKDEGAVRTMLVRHKIIFKEVVE